MWAGDFNRHHPIWDEPRNAHLFTRENLDLTQPLLNMLARHGMKMALPPFIPTLQAHNTGNHTRVDNVFCTEDLMNTIIKCNTDDANRPVKTDHYPIITRLDIHAMRTAWEPRPNFRLTDWGELIKTLRTNLTNIPTPAEIESIEDFDTALDKLSRAIQDAIARHVKTTKPSPYSKRWWTKELADEKKTMRRLGGKSKYHRANPQHPIHEKYRRQRNRYSELIRKTKAEHWVEWIEGLDESSVWQASRLVTSPATDAGKAKIPTIQVRDPITKQITREIADNRSKGQLFYETFFPPLNPDLETVPQDFRYPPTRWTFKNITDDQIHRAIKRLKPFKVSKKGSVPNSVLMHAREDLVPFLGPLFRATNTLNYYPQVWASTETLILKKPGKPDYTIAAAWRPVVLSDGIAKLLNSCQAEDMTTMCEIHNILPANHFGARPGRTTTDSIHLLTKTIKDAWRKGQVASILFLDVKGAFPSVDVNRLIHNMKKRGIPREYTEWMRRRLSDRKTTLSFDDYQTDAFEVHNGLDQGDPFSGILYLIYNADLLKIPVLKAGERLLLFVDDAVIIVMGKNFNETHNKLRNIMNRTGGVFEWAKTHNCEFGIEKFQLLDATRKRVPNPVNTRGRIPMPRQALMLGNQRIQSKDTARFLGIIMDNKLNWKAQCATALAKGQDWLIQFGRLARTTKGMNAKYIRQLYLSIAIPRMLYAADIFLTPQQNVGNRASYARASHAAINKLATVQRRAAIMITGAMKTTATDVIEVMANLLPFHLLVDKHRHRAAMRLATLPRSHPLHKPIENAANRLVKRHPTPLHDLMHRYGIQPKKTETIEAVRFGTRWIPGLATEMIDDIDRAIESIRDDDPDIKVFTDGSGMEGKIGAAAVLYRNGSLKTKLRHQLGRQRHHTVYEGEGAGILLGVKLISNERNVRSANIYIDNRAAIMATQLTKPSPGHYIFDALHESIAAVRKKHRGIKIKVKWVPGHRDVEGNEQADEEAKRAVTGGSNDKRRLPKTLRTTLPHSKSAIIWTHNDKLKRAAQKGWEASKRYNRMRRTDPSTPSHKHIDLITKLPRKLASILTQLRTGHAPLAKHLFRLGKVNSPICPACLQNDETVQHLLLHCPAHQTARQTLRSSTGGRNIDVTRILTSTKTLRALFKFLAETRRLHDTFGELPDIGEQEAERTRRGRR
jgi:ribonuclease HI